MVNIKNCHSSAPLCSSPWTAFLLAYLFSHLCSCATSVGGLEVRLLKFLI